MNYNFEYDYSYADTLLWGVEIRDLIHPQKQIAISVFMSLAVQFLLWFPVYLWLSQAEFSVFGTAAILFSGFFVTTNIFTAFLEPVLIRVFQGKAGHTDIERFTCKAEISSKGIKFQNRNNETQYTWDAFHSVHDTEKNIIFIGDTLHAVLPAKCFSHFLEKDAFVRECKKRMPAYLTEGPEAFD